MATTSGVLDDHRRRELLHALAAMGSDADLHPKITSVFLPLPMHADALHPSKLIVRGERGAGKTALFHFLGALAQNHEGHLPSVLPGSAAIQGRWVEGFSEVGRTHPSTSVLDLFGQQEEDGALRAFWFGHLVGVLARAFPEPAPPDGRFAERWREDSTNPASWVDAAQAEVAALTGWLDRLDERLEREGVWVFVSYDHLDKIGIVAPQVRARFASTLLAMWLSLANRYARLRSKVFLREDLFQVAQRSSTDASKLDSRSVRLHWSVEDLYRLVLRHLAASDPLRAWLQAEPHPLPFTERQPLGWFPPDALPEEGPRSQRSLATKLAGELMGEGVKKGYTHRWIPNHLQDAWGQIVPRSMMNLLAFAARGALEHGPRGTHARLLHPMELQSALEGTSIYRARELREEHPVVQRMERLRDFVLLAERAVVVRALRDPPDGRDAVADGFGNDGEAVFEELERLGVLRPRADGRVDVPDIYRFGYGIKRKGGVARPR